MTDAPGLDLSRVPLFPLPNVVLFPRAVLPLHIFEQRYKEMTADAIAGDRLIAMALLKPGWEKNYYGRPAIEPVLCAGRIVSHEELPDGRYNFLLEGMVRATIVREIDGKPYRVAELQLLEQIPATESDLAAQRKRLARLLNKGPLAATGLGRQFAQIVASEMPTQDVADLVAFTFLENVPQKQSLLAERDVQLRVTRTIDALEAISAAMPQGIYAPSPRDPTLN